MCEVCWYFCFRFFSYCFFAVLGFFLKKNLFPTWGWTGWRHILGTNISWGALLGVDLGLWADNSVCKPLLVSFLCNLCPALLWTSKCLQCLGMNREKFPRQVWGSLFPGKPYLDCSPSPPWTWGRRSPFITRKHMKAGLIPRVVGDVFGISVSTRTCQVFLNSLVWNLWICVFTHPGSASASQGRKLRGFRAQRSLHGTTAWLWDGSGTWMSTKPPSRMACDLRAEPVRHCNLGTLWIQVLLRCVQICNHTSREGSEAAELCMAFLLESPS